VINGAVTVIKTPYIFGQIKRKTLLSNTTFGCKISLEISPESFKSIDVSAPCIGELPFGMFYQAMHVSFGCNTGISSPGIRVDDRTTPYTLLLINGTRVSESTPGTISAHT